MQIPTLIEGDRVLSNDIDKATLLNEYFVSQSIPPRSNLGLPQFEYKTQARLGLIKVNPTLVKNVLLKLNVTKASGPDRIGNRILKECAESLCVPLSNLFNKSLNNGFFPSNWKRLKLLLFFRH